MGGCMEHIMNEIEMSKKKKTGFLDTIMELLPELERTELLQLRDKIDWMLRL